MPVNVFDLAGYTLEMFEYEQLNIFGLIDSILLEKPENDWDNHSIHAEPETPKPWVEYYRQSAMNTELLAIDDPVFKDHWKEHHSCADDWGCNCKEHDKTEWCYYHSNQSSAKCSQW
jgi:hypothetical protein